MTREQVPALDTSTVQYTNNLRKQGIIPAVKIALLSPFRHVLLLREANPRTSDDAKDNTKPGQWGLPGGRGELGETLAATAIRESREETGYDLYFPDNQVDIFGVGEWGPLVSGSRHAIVGHFILCRVTEEQFSGNQESDAAIWLSPEQALLDPAYELKKPEDDMLRLLIDRLSLDG